MVVLTFSRLLPQTQSPPHAGRKARHVHRLIQIQSPSSRPPPVLSFAPIRRPPLSSVQENGGASETLEEEDAAEGEETSGKKKEGEKQPAASATSSVPEEIQEMMEARKKSSSAPDLWGGVAEEVREIEWPAFGRVLGTTGVVLAVIAGSSIALLTVNAILAEISDRVFAGRGLQDFFG